MPEVPPKRAGTHAGRVQSPTDHDRFAAPRSGVPHPLDEDDKTGRYEGEELAMERAKRPTEQRVGRLEKKHDALAGDVREIKGKVDAIFEMSSAAQDAREDREKKDLEDRTKRRALIIPIITAIGIALAGIAAAVGHYS